MYTIHTYSSTKFAIYGYPLHFCTLLLCVMLQKLIKLSIIISSELQIFKSLSLLGFHDTYVAFCCSSRCKHDTYELIANSTKNAH